MFPYIGVSSSNSKFKDMTYTPIPMIDSSTSAANVTSSAPKRLALRAAQQRARHRLVDRPDPGLRVITSYSIHYTKLYDHAGARQ